MDILHEKLKRWYIERYKKTTFRRLLTLVMVCLVSTVFIIFSLIVTHLSEKKIRQNVKDNMSIVVEQFDVYLGNHIANIFEGFKNFESNQSLIQLQIFAQNEKYLSNTAINYIALKHSMNQFLNANSASVNNVYVNFNDGKVATQSFQKDLLKISYTYDSWKTRFSENKYYWVNADYCRDLLPDPTVEAVLFHLYGDIQSENNGIILIAIRKDFFEDILDVEALDKNASLNLITEYGIMQFGDEEASDIVEKMSTYLVENAEVQQGIRSEVLDGYFFIYKNMPITNWKLVYNIKESRISNAHYIRRDVMILTIIEIIAIVILISLLSKAVSYSLCALTKRVEANDILEHEINLYSYAEITSLSNGLEGMRKRINLLLEQVEIEQEAKHRIELALLQEQINPHFLYNTLYACMQLCEMKQPEKASKMLSALSIFYRIGLNGGNNIISVQEELRHVRNYLFIQHFRYSDIFDYTIDCDSSISTCRIPKMSLQPLVENAIYHGVKMKHSSGNICILGGMLDDQTAYLEVHDDGPGIQESKLEEIRCGLQKKILEAGEVSFGLKNVDSRIKFEFGETYGIALSSIPNDTCIRICFKMEEMKSDTPAKESQGDI